MLAAAYGIWYVKDTGFAIPSKLKLNGIFHEMKFIDAEDGGFVYEFNEICLNDCYHVKQLKKELGKVKVIADIGANQGLFSIAARKYFANAFITCYEPNEQLAAVLNNNAAALNAKVYYEAVTALDGMVNLIFGETDLHTIAQPSATGHVKATGFRKIIERAGGYIDILKMDCEGGEWDLLNDTESWLHIGSVTMEYHLWARPGTTAEDVINILDKLGFRIISNNRLSATFGLITGIKK